MQEENKSNKSGKNFFKKIVNVPFSVIKSNVQNAASKANPFDKNINKDDVSDSGIESIRLGYTTIKKGSNAVKTVDRTIKTTKNTVKMTRNVVHQTAKVIYKTGKFTTKAVVITAKVTKTVIVHVTAALMNPIVIIIATFGIILLMLLAMIVLLMGGGASASRSINNAYSSAAGLVNVSEQYQNAVNYFNTAVENRQAEFDTMIDNMYYDYNNLPGSSVIYMKRTTPVPEVTYEKSFSTNERKETLKSAWDMSLTITAKEAIAIAYIYLEKEKNTANHTEGGIYEVTYTQEVFDLILEKCVAYTDTISTRQYCPSKNCTKHVEIVDNPDYYYAIDKVNEAADNFNDGNNKEYWGNEYRYWMSVLENTPSTIEQVTYICELTHDLHSVGLAFFEKEDIMNALEFTDNDKRWEELTEKGFDNNPDISTEE